MKKILGLDIGTTSIGWAIVEVSEKDEKQKESETVTDINNNRTGIHKDAVGVRIIAQDTERFDRGLALNDSKGSALTPTANRRKYRGSRRMKSRYKLRRGKLNNVLSFLKMEPDKAFYTNEKGKRGINNDIGKAIYELRNNAISKDNNMSLAELGRIILHLNQWRGYSSDRFAKEEKPKFDYYTGTVTFVSDKPIQIDYEKNDKTKINWLHYSIKIQLDEPLKIGEDIFLNEIENGRVFVKEEKNLTLKAGKVITFKYTPKETKEKNIESEKYYHIQLTIPDPTDWNYKYQTLQKTLTEWCEEGGTVGSYFYKKHYLERISDSRIRNNVVNRKWYENEFDKMWDIQFENHKDYFNKINIDEVVKVAFKDYQTILNEVRNKKGIKEQLRFLIKDKIIFFQRPWQQAKSKGRCTFEKIKAKKEIVIKGTGKKETIEEHIGRTVIPRSHPLFQKFKIWQQINNVRIFLNTSESKIDLFSDAISFQEHIGRSIEEVKQMLYNAMQENKSLSWKSFCKTQLGLEFIYDDSDDAKKSRKGYYELADEDGVSIKAFFTVNFRKQKKNGEYEDIKLKGNTTKASIKNILIDFFIKENLLVIENEQVIADKTEDWLNSKHNVSNLQTVTNLQLLWEIIYDITETKPEKVAANIIKNFPELINYSEALSNIKFNDTGLANLSAKAIRQILPLMSNGENITEKANKKINSLITLNNSIDEKNKDENEKLESIKDFVSDKKARLRLSKLDAIADFKYLNYWEAIAVVYGSHSTKNTKIQKEISRVKSHSMNNPIAEKIVNETISVVNEINKQYGFDEVRIELSRELKASMDERQQMWEGMNSSAEKNEWAKQMLRELKSENSNLDADPSNKSNIDKIRIIEDTVKYKISQIPKEKIKEYKLEEPSKTEVKKYLMWLEQNFRCPYTNQPIPLTDVFARGKVVEIEHIIPRERYYLNSYANKVITWREVNQAKADNGNRTAFEFIVSKRVQETVKVGNKEFSLVSKEGWEDHIKGMFPKGGKRNNLLRKDIPEDPINRTLNETQYINKKLKEKLAELVGEQKVWITSGAVTDILRDRWHLNNVMKELLRNRFEKFNTGENKEKLNLTHWTKQYNSKTNTYEDVEVFEGFSKRLDHRHHALDAIIIACTKQNHIQYINTLNAINSSDQENDEEKKKKYSSLKKEICIGDSSKKFFTPWNKDNFIVDVKKALDEIVIAHKNTRLLISPSKHRIDKDIKPIKVASIRGELHKETNYAKKNYFTNETTPINKLIPELVKAKMDNQNQTMVHLKSFEEIIKETVLKEKYQNELIPLFLKYDEEKLNTSLCKEISKSILKEIETKKLLFNSITNKPLEWLSTYSEKDKSNRPNGLSMDLNKEKEIKDIADPRIKRLAGYRLEYVNKKREELEKLEIDKKEKDKLRAELMALPLYSNAIYELRIKRDDYDERVKAKQNPCKWVELKDFDKKDFDKIEYAKKETTQLIKNKLKEIDLDELKQSYFEKPVFISKTPILVKKVRQEAPFQNLYEVTAGRYVFASDTFMAYIFNPKKNIQIEESEKSLKREIKVLKFLEAVNIINQDKPDKINYSQLIPSLDRDKYELGFTLAKNDLVYLPEKALLQDEIDAIDWNNNKEISKHLYIVKDINPSLPQSYFMFQKHLNSDAISINETDMKHLFSNLELKAQEEKLKFGNAFYRDNCIKVFTDKLGKKVVPYWEFPNGCWDKVKAKELGLM
jgi:CRISPR/Cas system Type II protein with McrA/HNH and RuvC-like nuclease domain